MKLNLCQKTATDLPRISEQFVKNSTKPGVKKMVLEGGRGWVVGGGVDRQKAALKLLNTPTIASNCVQLHL